MTSSFCWGSPCTFSEPTLPSTSSRRARRTCAAIILAEIEIADSTQDSAPDASGKRACCCRMWDWMVTMGRVPAAPAWMGIVAFMRRLSPATAILARHVGLRGNGALGAGPEPDGGAARSCHQPAAGGGHRVGTDPPALPGADAAGRLRAPATGAAAGGGGLPAAAAAGHPRAAGRLARPRLRHPAHLLHQWRGGGHGGDVLPADGPGR